MAQCIIGCGRVLSPKSKLSTCPVCRAGIRYWDNRPTGDIVNYRQRLQVRAARIDVLDSKDVIVVDSKRKKKMVDETPAWKVIRLSRNRVKIKETK